MTTAIKVSKKLQKLAFKTDKEIEDSRIPYPKKTFDEIERTRPTGTKQNYEQSQKEGEYILHNKKIRPKKPTDMDYQKIIMASLEDLKSNLMEAKIAIAHNHHIEWRKAKLIEGEKLCELEGEYEK